MQQTIEIIGVPTSSASYAPGQEKAPAALRAVGLAETLRSRGFDVVDHDDDPPVWRWRPDPTDTRAQNLGPTVEYVANTRERVSRALMAGHVPLVLGGNCTIEIGTVAAHLDAGHRVGLVYLDFDGDLNVPDAIPDGALDWMGVAHMLGVEGSRPQLAGAGPRRPLLEPDQIALFGFEPEHATDFELGQIAALGIRVVGWLAIAADPEGEVARLLADWGADFDRILVHFDVDVLSFNDTPIAEDYYTRDTGLTLDQAARAISALAADPRFSSLTITEINPDHGAEDGSTLRRFVDSIAAALAGALP